MGSEDGVGDSPYSLLHLVVAADCNVSEIKPSPHVQLFHTNASRRHTYDLSEVLVLLSSSLHT